MRLPQVTLTLFLNIEVQCCSAARFLDRRGQRMDMEEYAPEPVGVNPAPLQGKFWMPGIH